MKKKITIAIDGPSGSGKSSTARLLAEKLEYIYIDTGAMYRAITLWWLENDKPNDEEFSELIRNIDIAIKYENGNQITLLGGDNVSQDIRSLIVTENVSFIASLPFVRDYLVQMQQKLGANGGVVLDGRDIGTVVFPLSELKIFLVASPRKRAERRLKEVLESGESVDIDQIEKDLIARDKFDSERENSPLKKADDTIELDTSDLTLESQVDEIYKLAKNIIESG
jgi:CMP/dCMP kinase